MKEITLKQSKRHIGRDIDINKSALPTGPHGCDIAGKIKQTDKLAVRHVANVRGQTVTGHM